MGRARKWLCQTLVVAGVSCVAGCAGGPAVVRVVNGHVATGRFIAVDAYAAFLRGALAEQDGDAPAALAAYEEAKRSDPDDPETWARIARVRCRLDRNDSGADVAIREALKLDHRYEPALLAEAFCATLRGEGAVAAEAYARAATWEPMSVDAEVDGARLDAAASAPPSGRADVASRLVALTLLHRDRVEAWEALQAWATAHGDVPLAVLGMRNVVRLSPIKRYDVGLGAVVLAGAGRRAAALEVAGALLDADGDRTAGGAGKAPASLPLVARMAIDEAIARRDVQAIWARAARAHLGAEVVAGRAWVAGDPKLARDLVEPTVRADPTNLAARMLYDALTGRSSAALPQTDSAPAFAPEVALPLARSLAVSEGAEAAMRVLRRGGGVRVLAGDALLTSLAVDLTIAGTLAERDLPVDARLELLARRFTLPAESDLSDPALDARHRLFGLSLARPMDPVTSELAQRLAPGADGDPLIASSLATLALAHGTMVSPGLRANLDAFAATDPIVASRVMDIARSLGPSSALAQARQRLAALARTPAERASALR